MIGKSISDYNSFVVDSNLRTFELIGSNIIRVNQLVYHGDTLYATFDDNNIITTISADNGTFELNDTLFINKSISFLKDLSNENSADLSDVYNYSIYHYRENIFFQLTGINNDSNYITSVLFCNKLYTDRILFAIKNSSK